MLGENRAAKRYNTVADRVQGPDAVGAQPAPRSGWNGTSITFNGATGENQGDRLTYEFGAPDRFPGGDYDRFFPAGAIFKVTAVENGTATIFRYNADGQADARFSAGSIRPLDGGNIELKFTLAAEAGISNAYTSGIPSGAFTFELAPE